MQDILLVTNTDASEGFIKELLMSASYGRIYNAYDQSDGTHLLDVHKFDMVLINAPMRYELGDRLARYAAQRTTTSVLFIARETSYLQTRDILTKFGILCVKKPVQVKPFQQLIKLVESTGVRIAKMEAEGIDVKAVIDEIRLIDAAKWHLIAKFNISEAQASRIYESYVSEFGFSRLDTAERILDGAISEI